MSDNEKILLPEVKAYFDADTEALAAFDQAKVEIGKRHQVSVLANHYSDEYVAARQAARTELREAEAVYMATPKARREALAATTTDPLVKWIAENTLEQYLGSSEEVLRMLPCSVGELEEWADDEGLCSVWNTLKLRAEEAGALAHLPQNPAYNEPTGPAWDALIRLLGNELYDRTLRKAKRLAREAIRENRPELVLVKDSPSRPAGK